MGFEPESGGAESGEKRNLNADEIKRLNQQVAARELAALDRTDACPHGNRWGVPCRECDYEELVKENEQLRNCIERLTRPGMTAEDVFQERYNIRVELGLPHGEKPDGL